MYDDYESTNVEAAEYLSREDALDYDDGAPSKAECDADEQGAKRPSHWPASHWPECPICAVFGESIFDDYDDEDRPF